MLRILLTILIIGAVSQLTAQRYLQLEKRNSPETIKYTTGEVISVKLHDSKNWYSGTIYDFNFEQEAIIFESRIIKLEDIKFIRRGKSGYVNNLMRGFTTSMMGFGATWAILSLGDALATERSFTKGDAYLSAGSMATGYLLAKFFTTRKYKIGNKWRFRMLNLDILPIKKKTA